MNTKLVEFKIKYEDLYNWLTDEYKEIVNSLLDKYNINFVKYLITHKALYDKLSQKDIELISDLDTYFDCYIISQKTKSSAYLIGRKNNTEYYAIVIYNPNFRDVIEKVEIYVK